MRHGHRAGTVSGVHRRSCALAGALALGLIATSCDITSPTAAKVNGVEISDSDFQDHLAAWKAVAGDQLNTGLANASFPTDFAGTLIQIEILGSLIHDETRAKGITPTAQDLAAARDQWINQVQGEDTFNKFPKAYADLLVNNLAEQTALGRALAEDLVQQGPGRVVARQRVDHDVNRGGCRRTGGNSAGPSHHAAGAT